jgi:hypothetical protein
MPAPARLQGQADAPLFGILDARLPEKKGWRFLVPDTGATFVRRGRL